MKFRIIAYDEIINWSIGKVYEKEGLISLAGYFEGPIMEVNELTFTIQKQMIDELMDNPEIKRYDRYEVVLVA